MRYLRRQVINRRAPFDQRLSVDINNNIIMSTGGGLQLPTGTTAEQPIISARYGTNDTGDLNGMIRYNVSTDEFEGCQSGVWRAFKFKESVGIIRQYLGEGDGTNEVFGPISPPPPANLDTNVEWSTYGNLTTPGNTWTGANIIVIVGNVFQVYAENYEIVEGSAIPNDGSATPDYPYTAGEYYIRFDSAVPGSIPGSLVKVYAFHGFDR